MKNYKTFMVLEFVAAVGFLVTSILDYARGDMLMGTSTLGACVASIGLGINAMLESKQTSKVTVK